jgi:membrane-associated protease RseP (regulator of RpoE activity)
MNFIAGFLIIIIMIVMTQTVGSTEVVKLKTALHLHRRRGLMVGDKIIKMNDTKINISDDIVFYLTSRGDQPIDITVLRNGQKCNK